MLPETGKKTAPLIKAYDIIFCTKLYSDKKGKTPVNKIINGVFS